MAKKKETLVSAFLSIKAQIPDLVNECAVPSIEDGIDLLLETCLCEVAKETPEPAESNVVDAVKIAPQTLQPKPRKRVKKSK